MLDIDTSGEVKFLRLWLLTLSMKLVAGCSLPLFFDENYYWVWGHHPQLSYFDHPAFVGWLFWVGRGCESFGDWTHQAFGFSLGQVCRVPGIILGHATFLIWALILKRYLSSNDLCAWLIFALLSPLWGLGSLIITPDIPVVFFWSLSMWLSIRALELQTMRAYVFLGVSLGLGFCSKYHIVLFVPCLIAYLTFERRWRDVRKDGVLATVIAGLLFCSPVLLWNLQNNFASFAFQLHHGLSRGTKAWEARWPAEYLLGQMGLLFPTCVYFLWRDRKTSELRLLYYFAGFPLMFFLVTSFHGKVEANWPIVAYPAAVSLAFLSMRGHKAMRWTVAVWSTALALLIAQLVHPWIPLKESELKTFEFVKFRPIVDFAAQTDVPLFAESYQMASFLSYQTKKQIYKLKELNRVDQYDFLQESKPQVKRFRLALRPGQDVPTWLTALGYTVQSQMTVEPEFRILEIAQRGVAATKSHGVSTD